MTQDEHVMEGKEHSARTGSRWSELYRTEDYWSIWLGVAMIACGLLIFLPRPPDAMHEKIRQCNAAMAREATEAPFRTVAWYRAEDAKKQLKATGSGVAKTVQNYVGKPHGWKTNPVDSLLVSDRQARQRAANAEQKYATAQEKAVRLELMATRAEEAARGEEFQNRERNAAAVAAIAEWRLRGKVIVAIQTASRSDA